MRPWMVVLSVAVTGSSWWLLAHNGTPLPQTLNIQSVPNFGADWQMKAGRVTVFATLSPHCPISNSSLPKLNQLHARYADQGIDIVGVIPGMAATPEQVNTYQREFQIAFPVLHDLRHKLCQQLGATHTPQAVVVDAAGKIVYSGRIDDEFSRVAGGKRAVRDESLKNVLVAVLDGTEIPAPRGTPIGCVIEEPDSFSVTMNALEDSGNDDEGIVFTRHIAPLLFSHCSRCHRPGEAAPFSLLTYEDAVRHARQIQSVVERRLMPPWKPVAGFGQFRNEHRLSDADISLVKAWIDNQLPQGPLAQMPAAPSFADGWQLGEPDVVLKMPEAFEVPADGPDIYQHFIIPTGLAENHLIRAFEFRPGAPEVVHHAFAYFDTTGRGRELDAEEPGPGYSRVGTPGFAVSGSLGGWGPGGLPRELPAGVGRPLPANADLVVQIHYHPSGRRVRDQSEIGLYFAEPWTTRYATEILVANVDLQIAAGVDAHHHRAEWTLPVDTWLLDATPHMHTLGSKIQAVAHLPSGETVPLIRVDDWDFYWQDSYLYADPVKLPAGTRLELDCWFDNSADNPLNPNQPPQPVFWGDFSDDEMGICYFQVTTENYDDYVTLNHATSRYFESMWNTYQKDLAARTGATP